MTLSPKVIRTLAEFQERVSTRLDPEQAAALRADVASLAWPSVEFALERCVEEPPPGSSHFGGTAWLPRDFAWPAWRSHDIFLHAKRPVRKLDFLLQIDLAEVASHDRTGLLPPAGLLTFLFDLDDKPWGYDPQHAGGAQVRFTPPGAELIAWRQPDRHSEIAPCRIRFRPGWSLPDPGSLTTRRLRKNYELTDEEREYLSDLDYLLRESDSSGPRHQLLGHFHGDRDCDLQTEALLVTQEISCSAYGVAAKHPELTPGAEDWLLLMQLDSDATGGFDWIDNGLLYFMIRKGDLAALHFDRVWMILLTS